MTTSVIPTMARALMERTALTSDSMAVSETYLAQHDLERYRRELTGYCYRMLGSGSEAEDAVQDTMIRAWRNAERFEGRSSVRSWLYRIATNVCIDMQRHSQRRARPMEMGPSSPPDESFLGPMLPECTWVTPVPDVRVAPEHSDPAEVVQYRETIRLAFVTALQHLPARQRASLILCEVLRWPVSEVAVLLDTSVAAVNSALQRARCDAFQPSRRTPRRAARRCGRRASRAFCRRIRALRHRETGDPPARGCCAVDASVRHVAPRCRRTSDGGW